MQKRKKRLELDEKDERDQSNNVQILSDDITRFIIRWLDNQSTAHTHTHTPKDSPIKIELKDKENVNYELCIDSRFILHAYSNHHQFKLFNVDW